MDMRAELTSVLAGFDCGVAPPANEVVNLVAEQMGEGFPGGSVVRATLSAMVEAGDVGSRWDVNPGTWVYFPSRLPTHG